MKIEDIEVTPLAAESLGVRSLCTQVRTPDVTILLDPSAALAKRFGLEPHPKEYIELQDTLAKILTASDEADVISISHYHYDHVRPGFTNFLYNLSTQEERRKTMTGKLVHAKDYRENINPSQRRRGFFFHKDVKSVVKELHWVDGRQFTFGDTIITYSRPLPHGSIGSSLGYVLATTIEYHGTRFLFAPDVQGPIAQETLSYILSQEPSLAIVGGPPIYLSSFTKDEIQSAFYSLSNLASVVPILVVDHHNMRDSSWEDWIRPVCRVAEDSGKKTMSMAALVGLRNNCYEAERQELYRRMPPTEEFLNWSRTNEDYKIQNMPPL